MNLIIADASLVSDKDWTIDYRNQTLSHKDVSIHASHGELKLFEFLMVNKGKIVTPTQVLKYLNSSATTSKIVDVLLCGLRKKIRTLGSDAADTIVSIWGRGVVIQDSNSKQISNYPIFPKDSLIRSRVRWSFAIKSQVLKAIREGTVDKQQIMADNFISEEELKEWADMQ